MLIADKDGMVKKITDSIRETIAARMSSEESERIRKKIAEKERALIKAVKAAQSAEDLISGEREREQLIAEIENLKKEQSKASLQLVDMEHTNDRLQVIWDLVESRGKLEEFDGDIFRKMVNRITVDGKELTYDLGSGITITDSIE